LIRQYNKAQALKGRRNGGGKRQEKKEQTVRWWPKITERKLEPKITGPKLDFGNSGTGN
jgi:hypothetical protein